MVVELLKGQIDYAVTNGVHWGLDLCWLPPCHIFQS
jgi:hypothetical protein